MGRLAELPRPAKAAHPWTAPLTELPGIGPALTARLAVLLGRQAPRVFDLLAHLPTAVIDPLPRARLEPADAGQHRTLELLVLDHLPRARRTTPYRIVTRGAAARIDIVLFGPKAEHLARRFVIGETHLVHGRVQLSGSTWQLSHPEPVRSGLVDDGTARHAPAIYPLVEGLGQHSLRRAVAGALLLAPGRDGEWADPHLVRREGWPGVARALAILHQPPLDAPPARLEAARRRLAYDELLASQLALALIRRTRRRRPGRALAGDGRLRARLLASLPFPLTACQTRAMAEIAADLASPAPMTRLLQGDVGSGKTLVALVAMLQTVEAGAQAALMAPTEVLARQHHDTLSRLVAPLDLEIELVTGSEPASRRRRSQERLACGEAGLVVGTHALFQAQVRFDDLGLAVIDEQHRFGVRQRLALVEQGAGVDLLLMSATPIPRTLLMAAYGDLPSSTLRTKPAGRQPVDTRVVSLRRLDDLLGGLARAAAEGERIFWICPLIEESAGSDLAAATARHNALVERFGPVVGLIHGRLDSSAKDAALAAFRAATHPILVATTVIEVGVDVPEAGIMVIEHAERFGLAQLHQLRGRVGRGGRPASCVLLYEPPLPMKARQRLEMLRRSDDGFAIAEKDLELRGPGEILGRRQSGLPELRFADLARHGDLVALAHDDARLALARDPDLVSARGRDLRLLLDLFERREAVRVLAAG